jgi:hypothetical protein
MLAVLLIAGLGFLLAGVLAIGFGIPVKEFSFGNTMILAGAIVACTGMMMLAIWTAVRELKKLGRQLAADVRADSNAPSMFASGNLNSGGLDPREDGGLLFNRDQSAAAAGSGRRDASSEARPQSAWPEEPASRDRGDVPNQEPADPHAPARQRRNLLFSSTSRKERERTQARMSESSPDDFSPGTPLTSFPAPAGDDSTKTPAGQSEDAWAKPNRGRGGEPAQRRSGRTPSSSQPVGRTEDPPSITVVKSGVVDGMAYSLYSDGSIEAQMPEGMMRFASIDELRAHLDQRP